MQNKSKSPFKIALSKFIHNKIAMLSIIFLLIITIVSIIAPLIAPFPVNQQDLLNIKGEMKHKTFLVQTLVVGITLVVCYMQVVFHYPLELHLQ